MSSSSRLWKEEVSLRLLRGTCPQFHASTLTRHTSLDRTVEGRLEMLAWKRQYERGRERRSRKRRRESEYVQGLEFIYSPLHLAFTQSGKPNGQTMYRYRERE